MRAHSWPAFMLLLTTNALAAEIYDTPVDLRKTTKLTFTVDPQAIHASVWEATEVG